MRHFIDLFVDTLTCNLEEPGIEPLTLGSVDNSGFPKKTKLGSAEQWRCIQILFFSKN